MPHPYRAAIITVSDSVAQGTRQDLSGPAVRRLLEAADWTVKSSEAVPDDFSLIRERLGALAADIEVDVVFTTGGTGVGPRDRTPEATTSVMERSLPGLAELMRREGLKKTPLAALSRAVVGVKGKALLVNLPGQPQGVEDSLKAILDILPHAVDVVRGEAIHPAPSREGLALEVSAVEAEPIPASESSEASVEEASATASELQDESAPEQEGLGKPEPV